MAVLPEARLAMLGHETEMAEGVEFVVMEMLPEKPPRLERVRVEFELDPDWNARADGLDVTEKSKTFTVNLVECDTPPVVAVTVME